MKWEYSCRHGRCLLVPFLRIQVMRRNLILIRNESVFSKCKRRWLSGGFFCPECNLQQLHHNAERIDLLRRKLSSHQTVPVTDKYKRISPVMHILLRPDSYIGSVSLSDEQSAYFYSSQSHKMKKRTVQYVPGLLKIFDEILVNAADNKQRDPDMKCIRADINRKNSMITVWNDGRGIPVEMHTEEGRYIPSLIFGTLLTSSNYDDSEIKVVGGRNGFGAKLCNIYSTEFTVETCSSQSGRKFCQTWRNNMSEEGVPDIEEVDKDVSDFTRVTFQPDLSKFHLSELDDAIVGLMERRVVDVAGTLNGVDVFLNGKKVEVSGFKQYTDLFSSNDDSTDTFESRRVFCNISPRWQIAVGISRSGFEQISFVNNIATTKGGRHVDYVVDQLVRRIKNEIVEKIGSTKTVRPSQVKNRLMVFVNSLIENPTFDSQTKEFLTTPPKSFGSKCLLPEVFYRELFTETNIVDQIIGDVNRREVAVNRESLLTVKGLRKLEDAGDAGGPRGHLCTLIVTEGDSAKALAVAGLAVLGRTKYGVFPLRGKLINVRGLDQKMALENAEISALVRILGLKFGEDYSTGEKRRELRYGKIMLMTDQDADGSHIKGLVINFLHQFWPSLIRSDFVQSFVTPLLKAKRGSEIISFYSTNEYKKWKATCDSYEKYTVKYYKGLGTSSASEAREYFSALDRHVVQFVYAGEADDRNIDLVFEKAKADDRKSWIENHFTEEDGTLKAEAASRSVTYSEFINKDFFEYSQLDLQRSIPNVVDGLKPSQRKVLFTCLKRFERSEVKVSQLAGAIAQHCNYHHGEEALVNTIVRMAQNFVGSNNLNLLLPIGQFGTRLQGGSDAASARYIYTAVSPISRALFPRSDDDLLSYVEEDNSSAEPIWFCPIIPLVLVNGTEGIGTGWATRILPHCPRQVIENVRRMIHDQPLQKMLPYYRKFDGKIVELADNRFEVSGSATVVPSRDRTGPFYEAVVTELPVGVWTQRYKEKVLDALVRDGTLRGYRELHTEDNVRFLVQFPRNSGKQLGKTSEGRRNLLSTLKLSSIIGTSSMVLFDEKGKLRKYSRNEEIFESFFKTRRQKYIERREREIDLLSTKYRFYENQWRFVKEKVKGNVQLEGRSREEIESNLYQLGFVSNPLRITDELNGDLDYEYLLDLPLRKLSSEGIASLEEKCLALREQLDIILNSTWKELWLRDLDYLSDVLDKEEKKSS